MEVKYDPLATEGIHTFPVKTTVTPRPVESFSRQSMEKNDS